MKIRLAFALTCMLALSGCVSVPEPKSPFDAQEAAFIHKQGDNTISGQAFLRRNDGVVVYAAGSEVSLIPKTAYAKERLDAIYMGGNIQSNPYIQLPPEPAGYLEAMRKVTADGEGRFTFRNVANGSYYVVTTVEWLAGYSPQGGALRTAVDVTGGQTVDVIMTGR
ncbi:MAG: carboxypeptidase-like regulatory domain-containing protein [Martelella sp.]|uniref:carboxypeptidase-like regulatory domain-containing protein n=1 Tax=Martelella sp. TaxID=1969699 RepID=UPI003242979F